MTITYHDLTRLVGSKTDTNHLVDLALSRSGREVLSLHNPSYGGATVTVSPDGTTFMVVDISLEWTAWDHDTYACAAWSALAGLTNNKYSFRYGELFGGDTPPEALRTAMDYSLVEFSLEEVDPFHMPHDQGFWRSVFNGRPSMPLGDLLAFWMRGSFQRRIEEKLEAIAPERY